MREEEAPAVAEADRRPSAWLWHVYLFLRPRAFFRHFAVEQTPVLTVGCAWLYGIAHALSASEKNYLRGRGTLPIGDWDTYLAAVSGAGVVAGLLYFFVGGWWYRVRIRWSGAMDPDPRLARRVYLFSSQIQALPLFLVTIVRCRQYERPLDALVAEADWLDMLLLVFPFWSAVTSYLGVRTAFDVRRGAALTWFWLLPSLAYGFFLFSVAMVTLRAGPQVATPATYRGDTIEFRYPANWWVEPVESGEGAETLTLEGMEDAFVRLMTYESSSTAAEELEATLVSLGDLEQWRSESDGEGWGPFRDGAGVRGSYVAEGARLYLEVFVAPLGRGRLFEVQAFVAETDAHAVEPVLELLRESVAVE